MKIELNRLWFWCPLLQQLQTNIWKISTGKRSLKSWTNHSKQISISVWLNCFRTRSKRKQNRLNRFQQEQVGKKKSKINWSKLKRSGTNSTSLWILIGRARTSSSSAQWKTSCRLLMTINSKYNPWWDLGMLVKSENKSRYLRKDSCLFLKSLMSGSPVKDNGCIWKISSVPKIFRNNYQRKIRNLPLLISSGRIPWLKLTKDHLFSNVVKVKICSENSKRTISNWRKSRKRWRTIWKLKELPSLGFISSLMMSYWKFYLKPGILMLFKDTWENASII